MDSAATKTILGRVRSLHVHPEQAGAPMRGVPAVDAIAQMGIREDLRYFGRRSRSSGEPSLRQVSLMAREEIARHAQALGLAEIAPGAVRANLETEGVELVSLLGQRLQVGGAILLLYEARTPCAKMDAICRGLRSLMEQNRQGVLAQVIESGPISQGDAITLV